MKNCGQTVHDEVASKQTMEELKELLKVTLAQSNTVNKVSVLSLSSAAVVAVFSHRAPVLNTVNTLH